MIDPVKNGRLNSHKTMGEQRLLILGTLPPRITCNIAIKSEGNATANAIRKTLIQKTPHELASLATTFFGEIQPPWMKIFAPSNPASISDTLIAFFVMRCNLLVVLINYDSFVRHWIQGLRPQLPLQINP